MRNLHDKNYALKYGLRIKALVNESIYTREEISAHVQVKFREEFKVEKSVFSLSGLDNMYKGVFPKAYCSEILEAIAEKLGCDVSDFGESEKQSA